MFDPIQKFFVPEPAISAHWARLAGIVAVGTSVGLMIGIVELLARDAWLNMIRGPLAGKEFLIFKDLVRVGASPASDIYLFNDDDVLPHHATIRAVADNYEIEAVDKSIVLVNSRPVTRTKLRHGDQIKLGSTIFAFQRRRTG
ncbi:MAG: FHA domain-containing protein [Pirellulaceae bacterium]